MATRQLLLRAVAAARTECSVQCSVRGLRRALQVTSNSARCSGSLALCAAARALPVLPLQHAGSVHTSAALGGTPGESSSSSSWWGWAATASLLGAAAGAATAGAARADSADDTSAVLAAQIPGGYAHGTSRGIGDVLQACYYKLESWLADALDRLGSQSLATKMAALLFTTLPVVGLLGVLYALASGTGLVDAITKAYFILFRMPLLMFEAPNLLAHVIVNLTFFLGFFALATVVAVVNEAIMSRASDIRCGRTPVRASDHLLLLGWNTNTPALLGVIATAAANAAGSDGASKGSSFWARSPAVVVLADKDKAEMDAVVQEVIKDSGFQLQVQTRQGNPFKPANLNKVSAQRASTVILLHPDGTKSPAEAEAMKTAAAIAFAVLPAVEGEQQRPPQRMIVQCTKTSLRKSSALNLGVMQTFFSEEGGPEDDRVVQLQMMTMPEDALVNRIVAQTSAQPGILTCMQNILSPATASHLRCVPTPPELQARPYRDIRRSYTNAVVFGVIDDSDGSAVVHLNPDDSTRVGPGRIIQLARLGDSGLEPEAARALFAKSADAAAVRLTRGLPSHFSEPVNILVAGWAAADMRDLIRSFGNFSPPNSVVTIVVDSAAAAKGWPRRLGNCRFRILQHDAPTSKEALLAAGIESCDSVVVGPGSEALNDMEADARVLTALLHVQEAVLAAKRPRAPHVVAPIRQHASSAMALAFLDDLGDKLAAEQRKMRLAGVTSAGAGRRASSGAPKLFAWLLAGAEAGGGDPPVVAPEFLDFRGLTSAVLAQVVSEPAYSDIMAELLSTSEGQELYLRDPACFNIPTGVPISFAEVQELARRTQQTALGVLSANRGGSSSGGQARTQRQQQAGGSGGQPHLAAVDVALGLDASAQLVFRDGDSVVVMASDFEMA